MGAFVRGKGKWDHKNAPSNRNLMPHNEVLSAILDAFNWLDARERQRERKREKNERNVHPAPRKHLSKAAKNNSKGLGNKQTSFNQIKTSSQDSVARHNIINSISDHIPPSKLTEQTRHLFKGKSFEYMANNYPSILLKFLNDRKELCYPPSVLKNLITIAKSELDRRASK